MKQWHLRPKALQDLVSIWHYTANEWGSDQADAYTLQIEHDLTAAANGSPLVRPYRQFFRIKSGNHLCVFQYANDHDIQIIRILHERMDIKTML